MLGYGDQFIICQQLSIHHTLGNFDNFRVDVTQWITNLDGAVVKSLATGLAGPGLLSWVTVLSYCPGLLSWVTVLGYCPGLLS